MNKLIISKLLPHLYEFKSILIISVVLGFCNLLTIQSIIGIIFTVLEIVWVMYLIVYKRLKDALLWHFIFIALSISSQGASAITDGQISLYNYAELKFIGPIRFSYTITFLIFCISLKKINIHESNLIFKTLKTFLFLAIIGDILGVVGLCFKEGYSTESFITYNVYIWISILSILVFILNWSKYIVRIIYEISLPILCSGIISSFIAYSIGIRSSYGGHEGLPVGMDINYYAPIILISILFIKQHKIIIYTCLILMFYMYSLSMGGKTVFILLFAFIWVILYLFRSNSELANNYKKINLLRFVIIAAVIGIGSYVPKLLSNGDSMTGYKIASAISLTNGNLDEVSRSPAIRIGEIANFYYNNKDNPFRILLGMGYGGYFTDELNIFQGLQVWKGGWSEEIVRSGKYPSAHDTYSVVPLLNGIIGLFLLLKLAYHYIIEIKNNYLNFAIVPWIIFAFYFSTSIALIGIFFLVGAQYKLVK